MPLIDKTYRAKGLPDLYINLKGYLGSLEQTSDEGLRRTMETNFFGVWRVTQAIFPLICRLML
ncbi:short-chain dehydrogenase/reductase SDR [Ktedonobacter racemifer DSM 44963]|uniref:Short-chain dehydrogenase/reductase SDR n=1 Tax=Ktedonobacter racemifer DSM 44963 TaxID=485913 RepID=D6TR72_KTERA|nr:short-chain dehydrogenase/reductase SDR [Ktedonobacter racemifer DSM 44963]